MAKIEFLYSKMYIMANNIRIRQPDPREEGFEYCNKKYSAICIKNYLELSGVFSNDVLKKQVMNNKVFLINVRLFNNVKCITPGCKCIKVRLDLDRFYDEKRFAAL